MIKQEFRDLKNKIKKEEHSFFHKFNKMKKIHQMWVILIAFISTILVWSGIYNLLNIYWFSLYNPLISNISSIIIGLIIIASTHYAIKKI